MSASPAGYLCRSSQLVDANGSILYHCTRQRFPAIHLRCFRPSLAVRCPRVPVLLIHKGFLTCILLSCCRPSTRRLGSGESAPAAAPICREGAQHFQHARVQELMLGIRESTCAERRQWRALHCLLRVRLRSELIFG